MSNAIFVFGPAGTGKSTFCKSLSEHGKLLHRSINIINFDPSQISQDEYLLDIRDYITTTSIMEECDFGPNGSLIEAFKLLYDNIEELEINELFNEYIIFDCPGQIELFMHSDILCNIVKYISKYFKCTILYFIESQCVLDTSKFMGNLLCAYISMSRFDTCMSLILSKVDMLDREIIENFLDNLENEIEDNKMFRRIYKICNFDFKLLDYSDEDSLNDLLYFIDNNLQFYDDVDNKWE